MMRYMNHSLVNKIYLKKNFLSFFLFCSNTIITVQNSVQTEINKGTIVLHKSALVEKEIESFYVLYVLMTQFF